MLVQLPINTIHAHIICPSKDLGSEHPEFIFYFALILINCANIFFNLKGGGKFEMPPKPKLNVQSFPRPPLLERTNRHLQVKWHGQTIADTKEAYVRINGLLEFLISLPLKHVLLFLYSPNTSQIGLLYLLLLYSKDMPERENNNTLIF